MILYIDANIFLNVWREEVDPKTGKKLWQGSGAILEKIEFGEYEGVVSLTTVMEILHAVRVGAIEKGENWHKKVNEAINKLKIYGVKLIIPTEVVISDAFTYFLDNQLDPYDSIAVAVAVHENAEIFLSRDKKLKNKTKKIINVVEPEEVK